MDHRIDARAVLERDLEIDRRPSRAGHIEVVLREPDCHHGGAVVEIRIGVPPFEGSLATWRVHVVLERLRVALLDPVAAIVPVFGA